MIMVLLCGSANKRYTRRLMLNQQKEQVTVASETGKKGQQSQSSSGFATLDLKTEEGADRSAHSCNEVYNYSRKASKETG